jgi:hypothetical protein
VIQPRRNLRRESFEDLRDDFGRTSVRSQPGQYGVVGQRNRLPVADSLLSSSSRHTQDSTQPRELAPILRSGLPERSDFVSSSVALGVSALCVALGLADVDVSDSLSRQGYAYGKVSGFFWLGLLLIFVSIADRVLMRRTRRGEQLVLIILLGIALYSVKILASPSGFTIYDEYIHWRNTEGILRTQHLFSFNPLLPTAAYYPGLAAITAGLVKLTGLNIFTSGLIVIGVARVLISGCFFLIAEKVTGSTRSASLASLIYATNPMFLFWTSSFAYENLAIPMAVFVIWWFGRTRNLKGLLAPIVAIISILAVTVTHHVAGLTLAALLTTWWLAERRSQRSSAKQHSLGLMALISSSASLIWFFLVARPAAAYLLSGNIIPALQQTSSLVFGHGAARHLYTSVGYVSPKWEPFAGFAAIGLLVLALPPALYIAWRGATVENRASRAGHIRMRVPLAIACALAVAYPLSLIPRLTSDGIAISGRSSEYIYTALGCVLGLLAEAAEWQWRGKSDRQITQVFPAGSSRTLAMIYAVTVIFVGNITIGTAFNERLPEPANPSGFPATVLPDVVAASIWAREHLGINQRFGSDALDALALATYGEQDTLPENTIWPIFFASTISETVVNDIRSGRVGYLLVDWHMTEGIPPTPSYYFSPQEPDVLGQTLPFPRAALQKFTSNCIRLIYQSGNVQIFDLSRIENGSCVPITAQNPRKETAS